MNPFTRHTATAADEPRHIDLHLPKSWPDCTTDELEIVAASILRHQQRQSPLHPFTWEAVKTDILFAVNNLEIVQSEELRVKSEEFATAATVPDGSPSGTAADGSVVSGTTADETYTVRQTDRDGHPTGDPFPLTVGQVCAIVTDHLAWVNADQPQPIFLFPYPELLLTPDGHWLTPAEAETAGIVSGKTADHRTGGSKFFTLHSSLFPYQGPPPMLDGYTWQEYRLLQDWMTEYLRQQNRQQRLLQQRRPDPQQVLAATRSMQQCQQEFLAVLFHPKAAAGSVVSGTTADNTPAAPFATFPPVRWQVVLFWWSSLMRLLQKEFPRVFRTQPVGKSRQRPQKRESPWTFYNRVTATIQKYIGGLSEQDVNQATYGTILQQLEMMAQESDENKKLQQKYKHHN